MSLVSDKVVSETNFNLTNQLCNLSVGYKLSNSERVCAASSPFVYDNYFEKRKTKIQNSLKTNLEEELLKKHLLVDNFQLKNTETNRFIVNAGSNNAAFIGPISLLADNFRLKAPSNFSLDSKKAYFDKRSTLWAKTISRCIYRKDFFGKSILNARSKGLAKNRKKLRKSKAALFTETLLRASTKIGLSSFSFIENRFSSKLKAQIKGPGLIKYLRLNKARKQVAYRLKKRLKFKALKKLALKKFRSKKKLKWRRSSKKFQLLLRRRNNRRAKRLRLRKWRRFAPLAHYESNLKTFSFVHLGYSHGNSLAYKSFFPLHIGKFFNRLVY